MTFIYIIAKNYSFEKWSHKNNSHGEPVDIGSDFREVLRYETVQICDSIG